MNRTGRLAFALVFAACAERAQAAAFDSAAKGTTTAGFLSLAVGARAAAMGEAYSAVADGADALYWNPAGLTRVENNAATLMHALYFDSSFLDYAAYAKNLGTYGAIGAGAQYFSSGKIGQTDASGSDIGSFTPNDLAATGGYAYRFGESGDAAVGLAGKFIRSTILGTAQTFALDGGVLSPALVDQRLRLALTFSNLGGKMKFEQEPESLPLLIKLGGAYKISKRWLVSADVGLPSDDLAYAAVGTEYVIRTKERVDVALRAGFNSKTIKDISGISGASLGFGLQYPIFAIDYAVVPFGSVGLAQRISLSFKFGEAIDIYK